MHRLHQERPLLPRQETTMKTPRILELTRRLKAAFAILAGMTLLAASRCRRTRRAITTTGAAAPA
jgi:hypothetical protein